jgi:hypothetical protein
MSSCGGAAGFFFSLFTLHSSSLLTAFLPLLSRQIFHLFFVIFALSLIPSSVLSMRFFSFFFLIIINIIIGNIIALGQIESPKVLLLFDLQDKHCSSMSGQIRRRV